MRKTKAFATTYAFGITAIALVSIVLAACQNNSFYSVLGNKAQIAKLAISPSSTTVSSNGTVQFSASGGVPPYTFSIISGVGTINASSGLYTAPAVPGTTYILVTDNQGSTARATVTNIDYSVTNITDTSSSHVAGAAISGTFTMKNVGTANGVQNVSWTVYLSTTATLGAGGTVVETNTTGPLASGVSSPTPIAFTGTWPTTPGTYYLIVTVSAVDALNGPGSTTPTGAIVISPAQVNYVATSITCTSGAVLSGGALAGNFQITNNGPNNGTQYVNWHIYASTSSTLSGSAPLLASGTTPPLNAGASSPSPITFSGQWPLAYGNYFLIVQLTVPVDINTVSTGNPLTTSTTTAVGFINLASYSPAYETPPGAAPVPAITLQPGMSITVSGSLLNSSPNTDNYLQFNTGTANTVSFSMTWTTSASQMSLEVDTIAGTLVSGVTNLTSPSTALSFPWSVTSPTNYSGTTMLVHGSDAGATSAGAYTLIISAN